MEVCIIDIGRYGYQIMTRARYGFNHVFPGKLFTMEEAIEVCNTNGFTIVAVGDIWQCIE